MVTPSPPNRPCPARSPLKIDLSGRVPLGWCWCAGKSGRQRPCLALLRSVMSDTYPFAGLLLLVAAVGVLALLSNRLTERIKIPAPLQVFVAAAVAVEVIPNLHQPREQLVERLVTVALIFILFDGGLNMGWPKFQVAAAPIASVGVLGTFLTVAAAAVFTHSVFGLSWYLALLVATAISPTNPAVVFSVLGPVSYTHLRAHETPEHLVCRLLLEKKK